jgi:hypothetical protein
MATHPASASNGRTCSPVPQAYGPHPPRVVLIHPVLPYHRHRHRDGSTSERSPTLQSRARHARCARRHEYLSAVALGRKVCISPHVWRNGGRRARRCVVTTYDPYGRSIRNWMIVVTDISHGTGGGISYIAVACAGVKGTWSLWNNPE